MVGPAVEDASFVRSTHVTGKGLVTEVGAVTVSSGGTLVLQKHRGGPVLAETTPLDASSGTLSFSTGGAKLFGRGASPQDCNHLASMSTNTMVCNRATYAPYYYSLDGYAALGAVSGTKGNTFPVKYSSDGKHITWTYEGALELYLMPAESLAEGTRAYYELIGPPAVPPRYAFGFIASRWGWKDRGYVEWTLNKFRSDGYPIDAFITDFEWFTNESDYSFPPEGKSWYHDFQFAPVVFPEPQAQLASYRQNLHMRMGGIRKPRLGNTGLLQMAKSKGWILPLAEPGGTYPPQMNKSYAHERNLNFTNPAVREWYAQQIGPLLDAGVQFWWNDEGEAEYFTFHYWNVAQSDALRSRGGDQRFYSLNRAWSPGMARLGATVWTGDISASWEDLRGTPGMMLNWVLAGAPYVACDIGGFNGQTNGTLLSRWMQVGTFMPTMRVHSCIGNTPHWPWNFGNDFAVVIRSALELRYRLLPYHYSLAHSMHEGGSLWIRPLVVDFPDDATAADTTTQWMDGQILVAPTLREDSTKMVYLPAGTWYSFNTSQTTTGPQVIKGFSPLEEVSAFVRPGTVITLAPVLQYTEALPGGPLEVQVYAGADGAFSFFEDDGETTAYKEGTKRTTLFTWTDANSTLSWKVFGSVVAPGGHGFTDLSMTLIARSGVHHTPVVPIGMVGHLQLEASAIMSAVEVEDSARWV